MEPKDVMPWVGLYICAASLVCTLAMAADVFHGFILGKLWFPCRFFTVNAVTVTVIAIAMKLPVDLSSITDDDNFAKFYSLYFMVTMVANFLPSLGLMGDKELLINIIALGILLVTILVNASILTFSSDGTRFNGVAMLLCLLVFSVALTVPACRRNLELQYKELHGLASNHEEMNFSYLELVNYVKMYWMMAETGFNGVVAFDNDEVPPLYPEEEEPKNCWSLVVVTLTAIAIALPNISNSHVKELLASMREGLEIVRNIEETLNENADLVDARKAASDLWSKVEVHSKWLQIDLQKMSSKVKTSKKILQWLGDEAVQNVIEYQRCKKRSLNRSLDKFIASGSMYRISQTILLHCNKQTSWPDDGELFEWISTIIADILLACFTNLPRLIKIKCHHNSIEKRRDNIRIAAQVLGKSKKILKILEECQLPNLDMDSMAYINKWQALPKSQIPNLRTSSTRVQLTSSSSNESLIVTVV